MKKVFTVLSIALFLGVCNRAAAQDVYWATTTGQIDYAADTITVFKNGTAFKKFPTRLYGHNLSHTVRSLFVSGDDIYVLTGLVDHCHSGAYTQLLYKNGYYQNSYSNLNSTNSIVASGNDWYYLDAAEGKVYKNRYNRADTPDDYEYDPDSNIGTYKWVMVFDVSDNDVYSVVMEREVYPVEGSIYISVYKNKTKLYTLVEHEEYGIELISVFGDDVYVWGLADGARKLWKNGIEQTECKFLDSNIYLDATSSFISGNDWYRLGFDGVYKNGVKIYDCSVYAMFVTPLAPPVVGASVAINSPASETARVVGYYSIMGQKLSQEPQSGLYIILYDNGKTEKRMR